MDNKGGIFITLIIALLVTLILAIGSFFYLKPPQKTKTYLFKSNLTPTPTYSDIFKPSSGITPSIPNRQTTTYSTTGPALAVLAPYSTEISMKEGDFVVALGGQTPFSIQRSIDEIEKINTPGVNKLISFNSITDLNKYISQAPTDVMYIAYDTEAAITPQDELNTLSSSVSSFAQIVHVHGKKMVWVPQYSYFDDGDSRNTLTSTLSSVDIVIYQGQRLLTTDTNFKQDIQKRYKAAKTANSKILFYLQLWVGTNGSTDQQIINGFNSLLGYFDVAGIGGGTQSDISTIVSGLSWRE